MVRGVMSDADPPPPLPSPAREPGASSPESGHTFAALRHPNYRLWFAGHLVSLLGSWMQTTAQGFLVFQLTRSTAYLGYVGFAFGLPSWVLMLLGGVVADRASRRTLLIVTQSSMMLQAVVLFALTWSGWIQPWHIIALALCLGAANAFDAPARQAFVAEMVDRETLTNAIALNSSVFHTATTVGPAIAGVIYAEVGPAWCFALNALSYLAVIGALLAMRLGPPAKRAPRSSIRRELVEALRFAATHPTIRMLITTLAATSLLGLGMMTLLPAWAVIILHGTARTNGLLYSARGLGSLAGALMIASLGQFTFRGKLLNLGSQLVPFLMIAFALTRSVPLSVAALVAIGWALMLIFNLTNALVQSHVPDGLRGRVMSIYTLTFFGLMPVGALFTGILATHLGVPRTVMVNAGLLLVLGIVLRVGTPGLRRLE
jgi:MFS family permease